MRRRTVLVLSRVRGGALLAGAVAVACTACTSGTGSAAGAASTPAAATVTASGTSVPATSSGASATGSSATTPSASGVASASGAGSASTPPPAPASVHANELGRVPVLMYHRISTHPTSDYDRRPSDFTADLTYLEKHDFVPVTAADFVAGRIDIPAGKHPVVLTFDDGSESQFTLAADGKPTPGTALALMQDFAASHPDFPAVGTFYVNAAPFGSKAGEKVLAYLTAHGDEVGDHTVHHDDLHTKTDAVVQSEIADNLAMITAAVPGYKVTTFALPFGSSPRTKALRTAGSSGGVSYDFSGVFAVGAGPAHSPYNATFDPSYIPRIRAENQADAKAADRPYISSYWLPQLVGEPSTLYTSDGDPAHVSYPKGTSIKVAATWKSQAQPY
jgi:peptidoglycan/xylan/chitin deacetylase (PgdA/CDA1 family)